MAKVSNAIEMLEYLSSGRKYTVKELAQKLEITPRMVRIYKEELEEAGISIKTIMGPYGGYVLEQKINIPERMFTDEDYKVLDKIIEDEKDRVAREKLIILRGKIRGIKIKENLFKEDKDNNYKYNLLMKAIKEKRKVKIIYYSYNKGINERIVDPVEMFLFKNGWYCAAYCELRDDMRHFELNRIKSCELLEKTF